MSELTIDQIMQAGKELAVSLEKEFREHQGTSLSLSEVERMAIEGCPGTVCYDEHGEPYLKSQTDDEDGEWDDEEEEEDSKPLPPRDEDTGRFMKKE